MIQCRSVVGLALLALAACAREPVSSVVAVTGGTVINVRDGAHFRDAVILVDSGRILAVGGARDVRIPAGATVIDARGKYVIPGFWDMHVHIRNQRELDVFFPLLVAHGVVGVRDLGGLSPSEFRELGSRQKYAPLVVACRTFVDGPAAPGVADAGIVDELASVGVDFIKVGSFLSRERFLAIMARANERSIHVAGHVPIAVSAIEASNLGLRTMEHLNEMLINVSTAEATLRASKLATLSRLAGPARTLQWTWPPIEPLLSTWSDEKAAALFRVLVANQTWQVPTLEDFRVWWVATAGDSTYWNNPDLAYVPKDWVDDWRPSSYKFIPPLAASERADVTRRMKAWYEAEVMVARQMHKAGVKFLAGTDASQWNHMVPGSSLHDELVRFVDAGFTPLEALQTATINPAVYLQSEAKAGDIAPGKRADLLILDGDPTVDIRNTRRIFTVFLRGHPIGRHELDEMLQQSRKRAVAPSPQ